MELAYRLLSAEEVASGLAGVKGWSVDAGLLGKEFGFALYKNGVAFAVRVAEVADDIDHHPDIEIGYQRVTVRMNTHSVGGLSPYDFELAKRIDTLS